MNKEGHIGIVKNTNVPIVKQIEKVHLSSNFKNNNNFVDSDVNTQPLPVSPAKRHGLDLRSTVTP